MEFDLTEAQVQRSVIELLRILGLPFRRIGQRDARGTQDRGVPDIVVLDPKRGVFWIECKRTKGGRQSPEQRAFQLEAEAAGGKYLLANDVSVVASFLGAR